jgi:drug/metabolite transporter (DMT)-like permease
MAVVGAGSDGAVAAVPSAGTAPVWGGHRARPGGVAAAMVAMLAWSASGVITKGLDMGGLAIVLYRMWLYTAVLMAFLLLRRQPLTWPKIRAALPGGIALGLDIALFFSAVKMTTMANATVIGALQPLLMLAFAPLLFGASERAGRREAVLAVLAIVGVAIVMFGSAGLPDWRPRGDLLSAGGLLAWTAYFVFSKKTQATVTPMEYTAATALVSTLFITPIAMLSGQDLSWPAASNWPWLVLLAVGPGLVGHGLMNWSLTRIPVWLGATLSLFIPATSTALAWLFIGEQVVAVQFAGMGVVLVALGLIVSRPRPPDAGPAGGRPRAGRISADAAVERAAAPA